MALILTSFLLTRCLVGSILQSSPLRLYLHHSCNVLPHNILKVTSRLKSQCKVMTGPLQVFSSVIKPFRLTRSTL